MAAKTRDGEKGSRRRRRPKRQRGGATVAQSGGGNGSVASARRDERIPVLFVCLALVLSVAVVFGQVGGHEFLHFDDDEYIYDNPHVSTGLTFENITWALTAYDANNWHPVTWISHMADCQVFGLKPGPHHLMNVALHALNAILLFLLLRSMTGALWRSAFVAAAFALHPMRVESIAWASERKDVLSTLFGLLTLWAYVWYAKRPQLPRYVVVVVLFALGLMAKPMLVTLPFVLLLLDYWPLRRLGTSSAAKGHDGGGSSKLPWLEKLPLVALVIASSLLTLAAQSQGGVVQTLEDFPLEMRVVNALVGFVRYGLKLLLPIHQAFYYPYQVNLPLFQAVASLVLLVGVTFLFFRVRRERPYALVGWLWYLGTLVPVVGLIQVATQAIADRYTYIPSIGFFVMIAWGVEDLLRARPQWRTGVAVAAAVALIGLAAKSHAQTAYWKDGITLFTRDTQVVHENMLGYRNLGASLTDAGRYEEAIAAFQNVRKKYPTDAVTLYDIGTALQKLGRWQESADYYRQSLQSKPDQSNARYNLGIVLNKLGQPDQAITEFREAIRLKPDFVRAYNNLANTLSKQGKVDEAIAQYREALRLDPTYAEAHNNLGTTLRAAGKSDEALAEYSRALALNPRFAAAELNSGIIYLDRGDKTQAWAHFDRAVALDPELAKNLAGLGR